VNIEVGLFDVVSVNLRRVVRPLLQDLCQFSEGTEAAQEGSMADVGECSQTQAAVVLIRRTVSYSVGLCVRRYVAERDS
jgi:hypothetical protein